MNRFERIAVVLAMGLAACSQKEPAAATPPPAAPAATATKAAAPAAQAQPLPAAAAPVAGGIAGSDGEKPGWHADITELKRGAGGTVTLKFVLANNSKEWLHTGGDYFGDAAVSKDHYRDVSGIHLIDPVNKKKYFVVTDTDKSCVCSKNLEDVQGGNQAALWAKFPAPPPEVTKISVEIPHFQPMDDVPISQ